MKGMLRPAQAVVPAGAKVVLMVRGRGDVCRVIDRRGRYVAISCKGLERIA